MILASLGNFLLGWLIPGFYVYLPEIYPTRIRALGAGVCSSWFRIGAIVSPMIIGLLVAKASVSAVFLFFGCVALFGVAVTYFFVIETRGRVSRKSRNNRMSGTAHRLRIAVDIGGTFTDLAVFDEAGGKLTFGNVPHQLLRHELLRRKTQLPGRFRRSKYLFLVLLPHHGRHPRRHVDLGETPGMVLKSSSP